MVFHIVKNLDDYYKNIMDKKWFNKLIICYFTASWCGPCRMISPDITTLGEKAESILVLKIDVDECEDVSAQCEIDCMPTFRFHIGNNLEPTKKLMGADKTQLFNIVGDILNQIKESNQKYNLQNHSQNHNHQQNHNQQQNSNSNSNQTQNVRRNNEMDVPFLYNPIPEHKFK